MPMSPRLLRPRASGATHPDAREWATRVTANGGTVSSTTLAAVSQFCAAIHAAGLRHRFHRLNLFCGNSDASLNAVRTPLYLADATGGSNFGTDMDAVTNFVQGDYAETGASGGLKGDGINKSLNTGFIPNNISGANAHFSLYGEDWAEPTRTFLDIGSRTNVGTPIEPFRLRFRSSSNIVNGFGANNNNPDQVLATGAAAITSGHVIGSSTATNSHRIIGNGVETATASGTINGTLNSVAVVLWTVNQSGTLQNFWSSARLSAYSIGKGLTASQGTAYYTAIHAFQTILGRNK